MLYILILICSVSEPRCDPQHARAYQAFAAPPGFVICGSPALIAPTIRSAAGPDEREYLRVRCEWRP